VTDPERAELLACQRAVKLALEAGVRRLLLETDSASAVTKIGGRDKDRSVHGPLFEDIKDFLQGFAEFSVRHVRRSGNEIAHLLAKDGCDNKRCMSWFSEPPPSYIVDGLALDCAGI
jgi:ribonuclease HI